MKDSWEKSQDAEKGWIEVGHSVSFVFDATYHTFLQLKIISIKKIAVVDKKIKINGFYRWELRWNYLQGQGRCIKEVHC